jgi:hypothetical protein
MKPEHAEGRDQRFLLPPTEGSLGPSHSLLSLQMRRTEHSSERTLGDAADGLLLKDEPLTI